VGGRRGACGGSSSRISSCRCPGRPLARAGATLQVILACTTTSSGQLLFNPDRRTGCRITTGINAPAGNSIPHELHLIAAGATIHGSSRPSSSTWPCSGHFRGRAEPSGASKG